MAAAPVWPVTGARAGQRWRPKATAKRARHLGQDIPCPVGTPVKAPWPGDARIVKSTKAGGCFLQLEHRSPAGARFWTEYLHLRGFAVLPGEHPNAGQVIAESGNTGEASTGPHLHLQIRVSAEWVRAHATEMDLVEGRDYVRTAAGYYLNPLVLLDEDAGAAAPLALEDDDDATEHVEVEVAGLGMTTTRLRRLLLGAEPPKYRIKLWCEWTGTQAAVRVVVGYTILAAAFRFWPFQRR